MCIVNHFPGFIVELFCISSRFFTRIIGFAFAQVIAASGSVSLSFFDRRTSGWYSFGSRRLCFGNRITFRWRLCRSRTNWSPHRNASVMMPADLANVLSIGQRRFDKRLVSERLVAFKGHLPNGLLRRPTAVFFHVSQVSIGPLCFVSIT
jgi:hypothetical protein